MCSVLSQANRPEEALIYARISKLICFDNLLKTSVLCQQLNNSYKVSKTKAITSEEAKEKLEMMDGNKFKSLYNLNITYITYI